MPGIGVDTDKFSPEAVADHEVEQFRNSINLGLDNPLFSLIGEFIPRKRHRDALMAFSKLNAPAAHLAFVGKGPLLENMRRLAARLGIGERVHFLGFRHDVPIIMRASVCVLSVSSQEGLPVNVVEALSLGVPVIGSDIRGTHDLLEDGCGILYPLGDRNQLTEAMAYVLRYPAAARELSAQGLVKMRSGYSREEIVNNYVELIKAITVRDVCQC